MAILALIGLVMAAYLLWARPYQLHWGSTDEEVKRVMPGDELNPDPKFLSTRAITINGTPEEIWPWLIQMGFGRAGYYGYDVLENLGSPRGIHSAEQILPEFQDFKVGDPVPISSAVVMEFYAIQPDHYLVWSGLTGGTYGAFTWALYPIDASHTRLVSRIRWSHHWTLPGMLALDLFSEFTDHIAVRKILQGVKDRVEGRIEPMVVQNIELTIYVVAALMFFVAPVWIPIRPLTLPGLLVGLAAGAAWLIIWYAPVSIWIRVLLEPLVLWGLIWVLVKPNTQEKSVHHEARRKEP